MEKQKRWREHDMFHEVDEAIMRHTKEGILIFVSGMILMTIGERFDEPVVTWLGVVLAGSSLATYGFLWTREVLIDMADDTVEYISKKMRNHKN